MSACLFMKDYSCATTEELKAEVAHLSVWLKCNKPDPKNVFDRDQYAGGWRNLKSVISILKRKELDEFLPRTDGQQFCAWLDGEGIVGNPDNFRGAIIDAITWGYVSAAMELID